MTRGHACSLAHNVSIFERIRTNCELLPSVFGMCHGGKGNQARAVGEIHQVVATQATLHSFTVSIRADDVYFMMCMEAYK